MSGHEDYQNMLAALIKTGALAECDEHPEQYFKRKMVLETDRQILQLRARKSMKPYIGLSDLQFCELVSLAFNDHPESCNICP